MKQDPNKPSNFYICDPYKNRKCDGRFKPHCGLECFATTHPECSTNPEHMLTYAEYYKEQGKRMQINNAVKL